MVVVASDAETPVTTPVGETVAMAEDKLLQVPPAEPVGLVSEIDAAEQTLSKPTIVPATGMALTVTASVAAKDPQLNEDDV